MISPYQYHFKFRFSIWINFQYIIRKWWAIEKVELLRSNYNFMTWFRNISLTEKFLVKQFFDVHIFRIIICVNYVIWLQFAFCSVLNIQIYLLAPLSCNLLLQSVSWSLRWNFTQFYFRRWIWFPFKSLYHIFGNAYFSTWILSCFSLSFNPIVSFKEFRYWTGCLKMSWRFGLL